MAYLTAAEFRAGATSWYTRGLTLTPAEASDPELTAAISAMAETFDLYTDDHFDPEPGGTPETTTTIDVAGSGGPRLMLPKRVRSLTRVDIRDSNGDLTEQTSTDYRLIQSLNSAGTDRTEEDEDYLEIVGGQLLSHGEAVWPKGVNTIRLTGKFSWGSCPEMVKRAVALMVWDLFKPLREDLHRAGSYQTSSIQVNFASSEPTGIPEADRIIAQFTRNRIPAV